MHTTIGIVSFADDEESARYDAEEYASEFLVGEHQYPFDYVEFESVEDLKTEDAMEELDKLFNDTKRMFFSNLEMLKRAMKNHDSELFDGFLYEHHNDGCDSPYWLRHWAKEVGSTEGPNVGIYLMDDESIYSTERYQSLIKMIDESDSAWLVLFDTHF